MIGAVAEVLGKVAEKVAVTGKDIGETVKNPYKDIYGKSLKIPGLEDISKESKANSFWESLENTDTQDVEKDISAQGELPETNESSRDEILMSEGMGGSYAEVKGRVQDSGLDDVEVHHMPADSVTELERTDGPAIAMDKEDHRLTASCGNSRDAQDYRAAQRAKIESGDFKGAMQMDIDDIRDKFGDKYDKQIASAEAYMDDLEKAGRI